MENEPTDKNQAQAAAPKFQRSAEKNFLTKVLDSLRSTTIHVMSILSNQAAAAGPADMP